MVEKRNERQSTKVKPATFHQPMKKRDKARIGWDKNTDVRLDNGYRLLDSFTSDLKPPPVSSQLIRRKHSWKSDLIKTCVSVCTQMKVCIYVSVFFCVYVNDCANVCVCVFVCVFIRRKISWNIYSLLVCVICRFTSGSYQIRRNPNVFVCFILVLFVIFWFATYPLVEPGVNENERKQQNNIVGGKV